MDPILIFERDARAAISLAKSLAPLGIRLHSISSADEVRNAVSKQDVMAIVVGPNESRIEVSKQVKSGRGAGVPVFSSGPIATLKRKIGAARLKWGCNKIFERSPPLLPVLESGTLSVSSRVLSFSGGAHCSLAQAECAILSLLAMKDGELVYKSDIMHELWGRCDRAAVRSLDVHICMLRQKLSSWSIPMEILSIPRIGFILKPSSDLLGKSFLPLPRADMVMHVA
jgi:DNA-binding response OmpR family regulator